MIGNKTDNKIKKILTAEQFRDILPNWRKNQPIYIQVIEGTTLVANTAAAPTATKDSNKKEHLKIALHWLIA